MAPDNIYKGAAAASIGSLRSWVGVCRDRSPSGASLLSLWVPRSREREWGAAGPCQQGRRLRMGMEGLVSPRVLWLLLWVQLCRGAAEVRLEDGGGRCAGRVEVKQQGEWGTVCSLFWDMEDAAVVCKQLGCGSALEVFPYAHFGQGSGPIWMDSVECRGTESALSDCRNVKLVIRICDHSQDTGVTCSGFVRLVGGDSPCSGRVEIRDGKEWKTVCDSDFGPKAAAVVCRELQCGTVLSVPGAAPFGEGVGPLWDRELQCVGNESLLASCPIGSPRDQPCTHANAAAVTCTRYRLVNGSTACEGRVEVEVQGTWGTLCASSWDILDAHVLCRHLKCGFAESIPRGGHFGRGTGPIWRDSFHCDGTEEHLGQCPVSALGASPCSPGNDAAVICSDPTRGRATGSGRLSLPVIICIILGALLCLLLALLAGQVRSARAGRRGSERAQEPFLEAVYEEIDYSSAWEKQTRFSGPGSYSQRSLTKLQSYPGDSEEEDGAGPEPDVPVLPGGDPADGYDDAREVSEPGQDPAPGQEAWEMPRVPEEGAGPRDAAGESTGYDDAAEVSLAHPPEDTEAVTAELRAPESPSPGPGEPVPAEQLGAARREERSVQLGEP